MVVGQSHARCSVSSHQYGFGRWPTRVPEIILAKQPAADMGATIVRAA